MCPGTDRPTCAEESERHEGADYARGLLQRIAAGASSPAELAALLQFLHSGSMLQGACAVLFEAMATARRGRGTA